MPYCKSCGFELDDPHEDLHDPDKLSDVAEAIGEGVSNPDSAHVEVKDGPKGWRYFCNEKGQVTSIVTDPPREGEGGGSDDESKAEPNTGRGEVYDLPEEKSAEDVLIEVAQSPFLDLSDAQLEELSDWADDYNGQIPPDILVDILGNFGGVKKQTAELAKQKYQVKLNKWVKNQTKQDKGPPIGISQQPSPNTPAPNQPRRRERRRPRQPQESGGGSPEDTPEQDSQEEEPQPNPRREENVSSSDLMEERRKRRVARRNRALDKAAEEVADQMAEDMAREMTGFFGDARDIFYTAIKRKVEKDPDWLLEKGDKWDIDIMDVLLEPSESRKEEMQDSSDKLEIDQEVDNVLEDIKGGEEPQQTAPETTNTHEPVPDDGEADDSDNQMEDSDTMKSEEDLFDEQFGDIEAGD